MGIILISNSTCKPRFNFRHYAVSCWATVWGIASSPTHSFMHTQVAHISYPENLCSNRYTKYYPCWINNNHC